MFGAAFNLFVHVLVRFYSAFEPAFFDGYDIKGLSVVFMTTLMGLVSSVAYTRKFFSSVPPFIHRQKVLAVANYE